MSEFLAEAAVSVVPDLTTFRTRLIRDLTGIMNTLPESVRQVKVAAATANTAAAAATTAGRGATQSAGARNATVDTSARAAIASNNLLVAATKRVELAERQALAAANETAAARARLAGANHAVTITERALGAAESSTSAAAEKAARDALVLAKARAEQALATLQATRASTQTAGSGSAAAATSARAAIESNNRIAAATRIVEEAEKRVLASGSALAAARTRHLAAIRSTAQTVLALGSAERSTSAVAIEAAKGANALAVAREKQALAALEAAGAEKKLAGDQAVTAARSAALGKGFGAQSLAVGGLRGAVLSANPAFIAGTAAAVGFFRAVKSAANLESELNVFAATAGATATQMERVGASARQLGADITLPGVNAGDAAQSLTELAKAGLSVEDSLAAARGVLQLGTAANLDNAASTELVASALNAFQLNGNEAVRVADLLTGASIESQGSIEDMGLALRQSAAAAAQAGVSVEDTVALLTLLARAGLKGSDAGTALRTSIIRLIRPTDEAQAALDQLGIAIRDQQGRVRPEVFTELNDALQNLTKRQRDATLALLFGQDAFRAAAILAREGAAGLNEIRAATQEAGLAAEIAGARTKGFAGTLEAFKNTATTFGQQVGAVTLPVLDELVGSLGEIVGLASDAGSALGKLGEKLPGGADAPESERGSFGLRDALSQQRFNINQLLKGDTRRASGTLGFENAETAIQRINAPLVEAIGNSEKLFEVMNRAAALEFKGVGDVLNPKQFSEFATAIDSSVEATSNLGVGMEKFSKTATGSDLFKAIENIKASFAGTSPEIEAAKQKLDDLARLALALGRAPTRLELEVFLKQGSVDDATIKIKALEDKAKFEILLRPPSQRNSVVFTNAVKKTVADAAARSANDFANIFNDTVRGGLDPTVFSPWAFNATQNAIKAAQQAAASAPKSPPGEANVLTGLLPSQIEAQVAALQEKVDTAEIKGSIQGQLNALRDLQTFVTKQLQRKDLQGPGRDTIRRTIIGFAQGVGGDIQSILDSQAAVAEKRRNDAKSKADKNAADARTAAEKIRAARKKADRDVVDAITDRSAAFDTRQTVVEATPGLADDITLARNRKKFLTRQIEIAQDSIKNDELLSDTLRDLRDQRRRQTTKIETLLDEQRQAAVIKAQERRDTVTENIGKQLQIAELRGGKDAILEALNRAIVDSRKRVAEAKKAGKGVLDAQVALETFLAQKREFLKDVEKEAKEAKETGRGTTAFGLLQQFAGRFGEIGGNLINGQQPFAGPTGFTADIAQFLKRQEEGGAGAPATGRGGKKTAFEINDDRLVKALGHLTGAIIKSGGGKSKGKGGYPQRAIDAMGDRMTEAARFYHERAAKSAVEAGA